MTAVSSPSWAPPFSQFNLSRNPFGEFTRDQRSEFALLDDDLNDAYQLSQFSAIQLIGRCGRGKTSHLLGLSLRMPRSFYVYLPEDGPCPAIAMGDPLIIDEAQRLARRLRRDIFETGLPLILGTHRNLKLSLRRYGYSVRTIRVGQKITPQRVRALMNRRLEYCRLAEGDLPRLSMADAVSLVQRFGSNVRAMENILYDRVQKQVDHHGQMQFAD